MIRTSYHHGNLKKEMLEKGLQLLNKESCDGFSLRKLAAMCDVSHAAPYRHFKSKDELIRAIWQEMASNLRDAFTDVITEYVDGPRVRLLELCKAYVRWMVENPDCFRYIFMTRHERSIIYTGSDLVYGIEDHPFVIFKEYVREYFEKVCGTGRWAEEFFALWSQIHGFSLLLVNHTVQIEGDYLSMVEKMVNSFLDSVRLSDKTIVCISRRKSNENENQK